MSNARKTALNALLRVEKDGAFSNIVLNETIKNDNLTREEASLATALFYGVLDRKITLDYYIRTFSNQPLSKVHPIVLNALRIGIYQIAYMDKIPHSAAVNESVKLVKNSKANRSFGYVNAVLRNAVRGLPSVPLKDSTEGISLRYSVSKSLANAVIEDYGFDTAKDFFQSAFSNKGIFIRVNTLKTDIDELCKLLYNDGIPAEKTDIDNSLLISSAGSIENNKLYKDGYFHVQDLSSQICALSVDAKEGNSFMDMCSAPGGKFFTVCQEMRNCGSAVACDLYENRVNLISKGAERLGIKIGKYITADATDFNSSYLNSFDRVLCDVPCSGSGIISRKPDIKYKDFSDISELCVIQQKILNNAFMYLKYGGRLVYSTCSILKAEDEKQVETFLSANKNAKLISQKTYLPHIDKTDGFFIAVIEKRMG